MGFRKTEKGNDAAEDGPGAVTPETLNAVAVIVDAPAPEPLPDPIVAVEEDGTHRPMSGGSFIRQDDGTLIRNPEA